MEHEGLILRGGMEDGRRTLLVARRSSRFSSDTTEADPEDPTASAPGFWERDEHSARLKDRSHGRGAWTSPSSSARNPISLSLRNALRFSRNSASSTNSGSPPRTARRNSWNPSSNKPLRMIVRSSSPWQGSCRALPGAVAALTTRPVIGVPCGGRSLTTASCRSSSSHLASPARPWASIVETMPVTLRTRSSR